MCVLLFFFFVKQKTAYEMRISDWSSDVCSSDLACTQLSSNTAFRCGIRMSLRQVRKPHMKKIDVTTAIAMRLVRIGAGPVAGFDVAYSMARSVCGCAAAAARSRHQNRFRAHCPALSSCVQARSEEHTSELQSLMRNSYAVLCFKKK